MRLPTRRRITAWGPVALWAGLIFGLSSIPDLGTGPGTWDLVLRKIAHAAEYAVLALLLLRAVERKGPAAAVAIAYAASDEIHQAFVPGRQAALRDVFIDAAGVLLGIYVVPRCARRALA